MRRLLNEVITPKLVVLAVMGLVMAAPSWALTGPALRLTDGTNTVTIDSTATVTFSSPCACTTTAVSASSGHVSWSGTIGVFTVTNVNGRTKPSLGSQTSPTIDVGLSGLSTGAKGGTITITWSDIGFDGLGPVTLNETTTVFGSGMATYTGYVDSSNALFGTASLVGTIGPVMGNAVLAGPGPTAEQFSMTQVEVLTLGAFGFLLNDNQLIGTPVPPLTLSCSGASGLAGTLYNSSLMPGGGVPAYTFSLLSGSLPPGMSLNAASGLISGTPTSTGNFNFVSQVMDSTGATASTASTGGCTIVVTEQTPLALSCSANTGQVGVPYSSSLIATGGLPPYNMFSITPVNGLPAGLFLNAMTGAITGTPTASGESDFTAQVIDSNGNTAMNSANSSCSVVVAPEVLNLACSTVTSGEVGVPFNSPAMTVTGGIGPYTYSVATGTLPAGLTLDASTGAITGTPTAPGTFTIKVTDANNVSSTSCSFTIVPAPALTCSAVTSGEVGVPFNSPAMVVTGGTGPYTFSVVGTLPAGLTLNASNGAITGTPTAPGTFTVVVTDANNVTSTSCSFTIASAPTLTCSAVNSGEVGAVFNSPAMVVTGGTAPFTFSVVGTLPAGLTLNTSNGAVTGTATAPGTFAILVTDANNVTSTSCSFTIVPGPSITCSAVTSGEVGAVFNSPAMAVTGGTAPYTFSVVGTLPAGLTLNASNGAITGTASAPGTFSVLVTDANHVTSTSCAFTIIAGPSITCSAVTSGEVGAVFNSPAMAVTGGTAPYVFSVVGTLPAGLTLNTTNGAITGTATASGTFSVLVTDANHVTSTSCSFTIAPAPALTCSAVNSGEVGAPFNSPAMTVTGGTAPFTFSVGTGTLPAGLTLNAANGAITGTPTAPGTFTIIVTDANNVSSTSCAFTIASAPTLTCSAITSGEVGAVFNSPAMVVTGGTAPYVFSVIGTLPAGLTLNTTNGAVTGTATASGTFSVLVTDANHVSSTSCSFTIIAGPSITCSAVTSGEVGAVFNSPAMVVTGGTAPYTFSVVGTLPAGLTLNTTNGAITGTATAPGTFAVLVTDANHVSSTSCSFTIASAPSLTCSVVTSGEVGAVFNSPAMVVTGGTAPFVFSVVGTLPAGLTLNTTNGAITGTATAPGSFSVLVTDANHVTSTSCAFTIIAGPSITCSAVTSGEVGAVFNSPAMVVTGGTAPYTFSVVGTLPAGLTLNTTNGAITGTATAPGTFSVLVTDANHVSSTSCSFTIASAPTLTCSAVTSGEAGAVFNSPAMVVTGGTAPYTFSVVGTLPAGLTLNTTNGAITGTPTASGTFAIVVTDANHVTSTSCSFNIVPSPSINGFQPGTTSCSTITTGEVGVAFVSPLIIVTGGTAPFTFSVVGTLPAGLTLNTSNGIVTGTPTAPGSFAITVTDANHVSSSTCSFTIVPAPALTCSAVTSGEVGAVFNSPAMVVTGGTAPFVFSVVGTLPAGLTLNTTNGAVTGTATAPGTFAIIVTDANHASSTSCSFTIASAPVLTCSAVTSGEVGAVFNSPAMVVTGGTAPYTFSVVGTLPAGLTLNTTNGAVTGTATAPGTFAIVVTDANHVSSTSCSFTIISGPSITCSAVTSGEVGAIFNSPVMFVTGGTAPYTFSIVGTLPAGLTLNTSTGSVSGTPTAPGTFAIIVTDANHVSSTSCSFTIASAPALTCSAVTSGEVGAVFNSPAMLVTGGTAPYIFSVVGTLPAGLTLNTTNGAVTGTATAPGTFAIKVTDANNVSSTSCNFTISSAPVLTCSAVTSGEVGAVFNSPAMVVTGGTAPYIFSVVGTLPAGLTLNITNGAVTGTATAPGTFAIKVTDANNVSSTSCNFTIASAPALTCSAVTSGEVGAIFNSPAMVVTGGTAPYIFSVVGTLPAGLTLNTSSGAVTGTATAPGTFAIKVTDANNVSSTSCSFTIASAPVLTCSAVTSGEVGAVFNSPAMVVTGGTAPYIFSVVGTLPAGLTLNTTNGAVTGTATAPGTFAIKVTDANNVSSTSCNFTISSAPVLTCSAVTSGEVGAVFNSPAMVVTGGTAPYIFSVVGTLPAGLTLNTTNGAVTGTATAPGTFAIKVTDANNVSSTSCNFTISAAPSLTCSAVTSGEVGAVFNSPAMVVTGGTAPYIFSVVGTLPAGLTLNTTNGAVTGTATAPGTFAIKVTDANNVSSTSCNFTISAAPSLTCSAVTSGEVGAVFNSPAMVVTGGTAPYIFSVVGTLPAGLTLNTTNGAVTGTATAPGTFAIKVTDANNVSSTSCNFTIASAPALTCSAVTSGEVGAIFNSPAMVVTGGTAPYIFSVVGTLPAGLTLNTTNGAVTGTATASGTFAIVVTDANHVSSTSCNFTISSAPSLTCSAVTSGEVGAVFNSPAMVVTGGTAPYIFSVVGTLPAGLTLNTTNGAVTGTATAPGTFAIKVTDANNVSSTSCNFTISAAPSLTCSAVTSGEVGAVFNSPAMVVTGGTAPYIFSVVGTLPAGLTLNTTNGAVTGTATAPGTFAIKVTDANNVSSTSCNFTIASAPALTCSAVTSGEVGAIFNSPAMVVTGGTAPYNFSVVGTLPAGLTLNTTNGAVTGTATASGTFAIVVTDANHVSSTSCSFTITSGPSMTCSTVNAGEVGVAFYGTAPTVTGGTAPYTFSVATGTLPAGLTLNTSTGAITGTPTAAGTFTIQVKDYKGAVGLGTCPYTISAPPTLTCSAVTSGEVGVALNTPALTVTGGVAPYTFSVGTGTLPAGLTLNATTGAITGTPTATGSFTIKVTDHSGAVATTTCQFTVVTHVNLMCGTCGANKATTGTAYSASLSVTGGTGPYVYSIITGSLPPGLTLNTSTGVISGTPTTVGTYTFTSQVKDSNGVIDTATCTITVNGPPINLNCGTCGAGKATVGTPYSAQFSVTGGTAPFTYSITSGSLPPGLTLNTTTGAITGTPTTVGNYTITTKIVDKNGSTDTTTCTIVVQPSPITLNCGPCSASKGMVGTPYSATMTVTGGNSPYTYSILSGSLPPGLTLNSSTGTISGTPTTSGTYTVTAQVVDKNGYTDTDVCTIVISTPPVNLDCGACGNTSGKVGTAYTTTLALSGGQSPFRYSISSGSLPPGLTLNTSTGVISGTPTTAGSYTFTSKVVDANGNTDTATCTIVVTGSPLNLDCGTCGASKATVGVSYSATYSVTGGTGPFTYSIVSGSLPGGLTLNSSTGTISGTPTTPGTYTFTAKVVDRYGNTDTQSCTVVVVASPIDLECGSCGTGNGSVGTAYSSNLAVTGGSGPYTYSIVSGSLPGGLTLNTSTGAITGTPTTAGSFTFTSKVVDRYGNTDTTTCTIVIAAAALNLNCGTCGASQATTGVAYTATYSVIGGTGPFTYSIVSGTLPAGLTLNSSTGTISGTPTTPGTYTFTAKVVDAHGKTDTQVCTVVVVGPPITLNCGPCSAAKAWVGTAYSATMTVTGGTGPFTYSIVSGSLPAGLTLNSSTGTISGTPTTSGTYTVTAKVVDKNGNSDTDICTIVVGTSPINLGCGSCMSGKAYQGQAYSTVMSVTGGTGPYTFSIVSGALPGGITLNASTGALSGTPNQQGTYTFTSKVVDKNGNSDTSTCTIVVEQYSGW